MVSIQKNRCQSANSWVDGVISGHPCTRSGSVELQIVTEQEALTIYLCEVCAFAIQYVDRWVLRQPALDPEQPPSISSMSSPGGTSL